MTQARSRTIVLVVLVLISFSNAAGQLFFKAARLAEPGAPLASLFFHPQTWAGFFFYGLAAVGWLWVLSRAPLSLAYPILGLSFPIIVALSVVFFAEPVSPGRWLGVGFIVAGVALMART